MRRRVLLLLLLVRQIPPIIGEHSSTRTLMLPSLEDCKLAREREPNPEGLNNRLTNVLGHCLDGCLNVTLKMYVKPPLRVRLESQTIQNDEVLAVHAKIFVKMTYVDPAIPNSSYPSLTPPCEQLWLPQPRPGVVAHVIGSDAPTDRDATLRILSDGRTSSLWDQRVYAFPQSDWTYVNFPYDVHMATMRFKVNDAHIRFCNDHDLRTHTLEEIEGESSLTESEYLSALAPTGWSVGSLSQWRAFPGRSTSTYGQEINAEYCTIQIPLVRNPTPYVLKYYVFDVLFVLAGVISANFDAHEDSLHRYSIIVLCMLLLLTTVRRDLGYGLVEYVTIIDIQSFISMIILSLCLCQTVIRHKLGRTQVGTTVDRVTRETLICAGFVCAIGFLVQLVASRPSPSSAPPVFKELQTETLAPHLWPWLVFGLLWMSFSVVRIYRIHPCAAVRDEWRGQEAEAKGQTGGDGAVA